MDCLKEAYENAIYLQNYTEMKKVAKTLFKNLEENVVITKDELGIILSYIGKLEYLSDKVDNLEGYLEYSEIEDLNEECSKLHDLFDRLKKELK